MTRIRAEGPIGLYYKWLKGVVRELCDERHIFHILTGTDAANFDFTMCPDLAAAEYRIWVKSKLPHLDSILDGHFVARYRIWDGLGKIESRWPSSTI